MTSTAWQSLALGRIIGPWAAMIAELFGIIAGLIVAKAGKVRHILHRLGARALAGKPSPEFARAVVADLSGKSEGRISPPAACAAAVLVRISGVARSLSRIPGQTSRCAKGLRHDRGAGGLHSVT